MTGHEEWEELAAGHALDALEPEDEETFVRHLRGCDVCAESLTELRAVAAQLAAGVEDLEPPARLREAIVAGVRGSSRKPMPVVSSLAARRESRGHRVVGAPLVAAAAVVALLVIGSWAAGMRSELDATRTALARRDRLAEVMTDPTTRRVSMTSTGAAHGDVLVRDAEAFVVVQGLAPNDAAHTYVLWFRTPSGAMRAVQPFDVVRTGVNVLELPFPVAWQDIRAFAVSREVGRKAPETPSSPVLSGAVA